MPWQEQSHGSLVDANDPHDTKYLSTIYPVD
jgi:hypothetical protein